MVAVASKWRWQPRRQSWRELCGESGQSFLKWRRKSKWNGSNRQRKLQLLRWRSLLQRLKEFRQIGHHHWLQPLATRTRQNGRQGASDTHTFRKPKVHSFTNHSTKSRSHFENGNHGTGGNGQRGSPDGGKELKKNKKQKTKKNSRFRITTKWLANNCENTYGDQHVKTQVDKDAATLRDPMGNDFGLFYRQVITDPSEIGK